MLFIWAGSLGRGATATVTTGLLIYSDTYHTGRVAKTFTFVNFCSRIPFFSFLIPLIMRGGLCFSKTVEN